MTPDALSQLIINYRYLILLPLSFIEGPIIAFIAGTLASLGYFNVYVLFVFFLVRDVAVDLICYLFGRFLGKKEYTRRFLNRIHIYEDDIANVRHMWLKHPGKTMFFGKLSYGVAAGFIVVAGMVEMPLRTFFKWGTLVALMHYGVLLFLGFYFGSSFGSVTGILEHIQYVIGGLVLLGTAYYFGKRFITNRMRQEEKKAAQEITEESEVSEISKSDTSQ
jgi:membrane protein DedA with SNARE-associated domain